jgi:hypothetical protein
MEEWLEKEKDSIIELLKRCPDNDLIKVRAYFCAVEKIYDAIVYDINRADSANKTLDEIVEAEDELELKARKKRFEDIFN